MEYKCDICKKDYKTYQTRWNHMKKFHMEKGKSEGKCIKKTGQSGKSKGKCKTKKINEIIQKDYKCRKCAKVYKYKQSRWAHEKICENKSTNTIINNITNNTNINNGIILENFTFEPFKILNRLLMFIYAKITLILSSNKQK